MAEAVSMIGAAKLEKSRAGQDLFGRSRWRVLGLGKIDFLREWKQDRADLADGLISHRSVYETEASPGPLLTNEGGDLARPCGGVGAGQHPQRAFQYGFETPGPRRL